MIEVEIEDQAWTSALPSAAEVAERAGAAVLDQISPAEDGEPEVAILLTSDEAVAAPNQRFRGRAGPTNVLSFPASANPENHLGDVALAHGVCAREAAGQGKRLDQHLAHLV